MTTKTTKLGLSKPAPGSVSWTAEFNANLDTLDAMGYVTTPLSRNMLTSDPDVTDTGTWARTRDSAYLYCGHFANSTAADADAFSVKFRCPAGTYTLRFNAPKRNDVGIVKPYIDGVQKGDAGGYDLYAASADNLNCVEITGLTLTAGEHTLKFKIDGKNASSSGYRFRASGINLQRTA